MIVGGSFQGTRTNGTVFVVEIARSISTTVTAAPSAANRSAGDGTPEGAQFTVRLPVG